MAEDQDRMTPEEAGPAEGEMGEAEIDRTLTESFPASDPPSWTLGIDHRQEPPAPTSGRPTRKAE